MPPRQKRETQEEKPKLVVQEKHVKYVGLSDIRIIRKEDWAMIGVEHDDVIWNRRNRFTVPADKLSKEVLEYCQHDPELVIVSE